MSSSPANDDNANLKYRTLDARIAETYVARSVATRSASMYDSYVRAFRWATDRLGNQGVIAFVSNNGWIDSNSADGLRKTFTSEFSDLWVYNLRGNQRTAGELSRQEGGKVFGSGSRTGVAVLVAVKRPAVEEPCTLRYQGVPDYQTREEKLADIVGVTITSSHWSELSPNPAGDWISQRAEVFGTFAPLSSKSPDPSTPQLFSSYSGGLSTNRDAWIYSFGRAATTSNMRRMIANFNSQAARGASNASMLDRDPSRISWTDLLERDALAGRTIQFDPDASRLSLYRPFCEQWLYYDRRVIHRLYQLGSSFPTPAHENEGYYIVAPGSDKPFSVLALRLLPNLSMWGSSGGQFFPRWTYEKPSGTAQGLLLEVSNVDVDESGYRRVDNITDGILAVYRDKFGPQITKDDIFTYVYGVLHSEQYRTMFAADLKRTLPRIPLAASSSDFAAFAEAGRKLADLHVNYESVEPYPLAEQAPFSTDPWETFRVEKMRWADKTTKKAIVYNRHVTLGDIPAEAHRYMLGSRSALEWLIDRYQVKTDKDSGIVNDPNDWCREHGDPRYIVDLIKRVTRVSVETMRIVDGLPSLPL